MKTPPGVVHLSADLEVPPSRTVEPTKEFGRIRSSYNAVGTGSARMSSEQRMTEQRMTEQRMTEQRSSEQHVTERHSAEFMRDYGIGSDREMARYPGVVDWAPCAPADTASTARMRFETNSSVGGVAGRSAGDIEISPPLMSASSSRRLGEGDTSVHEGALQRVGGSIGTDLAESLNQLIRMVANVTEAYSSAIFLVRDGASPGSVSASSGITGAAIAGSSVSGGMTSGSMRCLELAAIHTLSRDIDYDVLIGFGSGLVGWTAEHGVRISVCPFEHDASTLLYYRTDQGLKSFIALPIITKDGVLLGVLACDSKRSYAFAKVTEKVLIDCAQQVATMVTLHRKLSQFGSVSRREASSDALEVFIERLRNQTSERELLTLGAEIPSEIVERDALVVITVADGNLAPAAFYSTANQVRVGHRLLELVCRHKRVLCPDRSVHATTTGEGDRDRSFLSIPFHVGKREAGSINLLSPAFESFTTSEISSLERIAKVLGKELELFRLRERHVSPDAASGLLTWEQFSAAGRQFLADAAGSRRGASLIRIVPDNIGELEDFLGVEGARRALTKLARLVEQVKGSSAIAGLLYGHELLILAERSEGERILGRFERLLERFALDDEGGVTPTRSATRDGTGVRDPVGRHGGMKVSSLMTRGLSRAIVSTSRDGDTLEELLAKSNRMIESANESKPGEVIAHASNW